jgi:hypothetical protein
MSFILMGGTLGLIKVYLYMCIYILVCYVYISVDIYTCLYIYIHIYNEIMSFILMGGH